MNFDSVLQDILVHLVTFCVQGMKKPEEIIVSEKIMEMLNALTVLPRSVQFIGNKFYIADVPVELGTMQYKNIDIWYRIV